MLPRLLLAVTLLLSAPPPADAQQPVPKPLPSADYSRQPFVFEQIREVARFDDDGRGALTLAARVRIQSEAGLQAFGELTLPYSAANQRLDVDTVRVHKAGGSVVLAPASAVQDVTSPIAREAPVYSDLRAKIVTVPGLRPGDTLEYHLTWTIHTPLAPGQFWWATTFVRTAIVLDQTLTLLEPRARPLHVKTIGLAAPKVSEAGDRRTYAWHYANLQVDTAGRVEGRPGRRPPEPHAVQVSSFGTWEEVGRWYAGLERERETLTPELRAKAESLVAGRTSLRDSVAALYAFVANQFRYVSLSFGLGRYQPHAASEVLTNQYGDCKDKHTLLAALLRAIGIASAPALISSERDLDPDMPSPAQFDHVITYIPARTDTLWVDATPAGAPLAFLFFPLRDKGTLVMPLDGTPTLARTPARLPFTSFQHTDVDGTLDELGRFTASVHYAFRGDAEVVLREMFRQVPAERVPAMLENMAAHHGVRGTVSAPHPGDPAATATPFEVSFTLAEPSLTWTEHQAVFPFPAAEFDLPVADEDGSALRDTLSVGVTEEESVTMKLELSPAITARLPLPVALTRDYATYRSSYASDGRTVRMERALKWRQRELRPEQLADLRAFARTVRADEAQHLHLSRAASAPAIPATASATELHRAGWDALGAGDARTAVRLFRQVVTLDPRHAVAWNNLGRAYMQLGQLDSAVKAFDQQIAVNPYDPSAYNNRGLAQWRLRAYDDAAASFKKQIEVTPLDQFAHSHLGRLDVAMHRDSEAVAELEKAVSITPNNAYLHVDLGKAYLTARRSDQATAEFDRAVELAPNPAIWNNVAYALAELGTKLDKAERYVRSAIDATNAVLRGATLDQTGLRQAGAVVSIGAYWDTLGWIYFQQGDLARAERYVGAAWLLAQQGEVGDHLAQIYQRLGRTQEAIHTYALALNGMNPVPDTKGRLAALAGGSAAADRLAEAVRPGLITLRTVHLGATLKLDVASEVQVLLAPGPKVEDVRFIGGPDAARRLGDAIRGATFPVAFPDSDVIKLPRRALLTCTAAKGVCSLVLIEPGIGAMPPPPPRN
jgi:Flp pilus assembly protein TadD